VLPPKCDLRIAKVASPSRASVYLADGAPVLVDSSSKGDWLPTLFALWRAPTLLPALNLKHAAVSKFLLGACAVRLMLCPGFTC
jgi:translation initiation factor 2D